MTTDERLMRRCLYLARQALANGEVPVGAVVVEAGQVVADGMESTRVDLTAHAEVCAIRAACHRLGRRTLHGATLYSTVEPCVLCAYVIRHAGIARVVYGIPAGALGAHTSSYALLADTTIPGSPPPAILAGVLSGECGALMRRYTAGSRRSRGTGGG